jgi:PAS domain S-box
MKAGFLEKLIERLGRIGPEEVQNYFLRLAQEKGFLETVFNAIHEGIIVTDSSGRVTYLNDAACKLFGLEAADAIGKRLDERVRGLDWRSLTQSGGPLSRDMEIFYPENRFINFYIVPLMIEHREAVDVTTPARGVREETGHPPSRGYGEASSPRLSRGAGGTRHDPARHYRKPAHNPTSDRVRTPECAYVAGGRRGARNW